MEGIIELRKETGVLEIIFARGDTLFYRSGAKAF